MDCLKCELRRAMLRASTLSFFGRSLESIAEDLSERYGENYFVMYSADVGIKREVLYRASKIPPYEPHEIARKVKHE